MHKSTSIFIEQALAARLVEAFQPPRDRLIAGIRRLDSRFRESFKKKDNPKEIPTFDVETQKSTPKESQEFISPHVAEFLKENPGLKPLGVQFIEDHWQQIEEISAHRVSFFIFSNWLHHFDVDWVQQHWNDLLKLIQKAAPSYIYALSDRLINIQRTFGVEWMDVHWNDLVELGLAEVSPLTKIKTGLEQLKDGLYNSGVGFGTEWINRHWQDLVTLQREAGQLNAWTEIARTEHTFGRTYVTDHWPELKVALLEILRTPKNRKYSLFDWEPNYYETPQLSTGQEQELKNRISLEGVTVWATIRYGFPAVLEAAQDRPNVSREYFQDLDALNAQFHDILNMSDLSRHFVEVIAASTTSSTEFKGLIREAYSLLERIPSHYRPKLVEMLSKTNQRWLLHFYTLPTIEALMSQLYERGSPGEIERFFDWTTQAALTSRADQMQTESPFVDCVVRLFSAGIAPTPELLDTLEKELPGQRDQVVHSWSERLDNFREKRILWNSEEQLHRELGYTLFLNAFDLQAYQSSIKTDYQSYRGFIQSASTNEPLVQDAEHNAELLYLAYEAHRFEDYVLALKARLPDRRPLWVVENLRYGGIALAPVKDRLITQGIRIVSAKIGSTESHHDPFVFRSDLFSAEDLALMVKEKPIIVVVDASTSVNDPSRTLAHYPDAYQGYRNFGIAFHLMLGELDEQVAKKFGVSTDFIRTFTATPAFKEFQVQLKPHLVEKGSTAQATGGLAFWTPSDVALQIREDKKGTGFEKAPHPLIPETWSGQDMIFVESAMESEAIMKAAPSDPAAQYVLDHTPTSYSHQAAYFDDTDHFLQFHLHMGPYGPEASHIFAQVARNNYERLTALTSGPSKTIYAHRFPYALVLSDYDGTLGLTKKPLHAAVVGMLIQILASGTDFCVMTLQGKNELETNLIRPILAYLQRHPEISTRVLSHLHLYPDMGFAYDVATDGSLIRVWNSVDDTISIAQRAQAFKAIKTIHRSIPSATLEDHDGFFIFHAVPERAKNIKHLVQVLSGLPYDVLSVGRKSVHIVPKGLTKAASRDHALKRFMPMPSQILTLGNDYSGSRTSDSFLIVDGARNISVAERRPARSKVEYVGRGPVGSYELFRALIETEHRDAKPKLPAPKPMNYRLAAAWGLWMWFGFSAEDAATRIAPRWEPRIVLTAFAAILAALHFFALSMDLGSSVGMAALFGQGLFASLHLTGVIAEDENGEWAKTKASPKSLLNYFTGIGLVFHAPFYISLWASLHVESTPTLLLAATSGVFAEWAHTVHNQSTRQTLQAPFAKAA